MIALYDTLCIVCLQLLHNLQENREEGARESERQKERERYRDLYKVEKLYMTKKLHSSSNIFHYNQYNSKKEYIHIVVKVENIYSTVVCSI